MSTPTQIAVLTQLATHHRTYEDESEAIVAVLNDLTALRAELQIRCEEIIALRKEDKSALRAKLAEVEAHREKLKRALASSCDDEREMAISEGPGHSTCGLADELTEKLATAERERDEARKSRDEAGEKLVHHQQRADKFWLMLCDTAEALGKVAPEAAPYTAEWARKIVAERDEARALVSEGLAAGLSATGSSTHTIPQMFDLCETWNAQSEKTIAQLRADLAAVQRDLNVAREALREIDATTDDFLARRLARSVMSIAAIDAAKGGTT